MSRRPTLLVALVLLSDCYASHFLEEDCAAQEYVVDDGPSDFRGCFWTGSDCTCESGTECMGVDCDAAFATLAACREAYAMCTDAPDPCTGPSLIAEGHPCRDDSGCCAGLVCRASLVNPIDPETGEGLRTCQR